MKSGGPQRWPKEAHLRIKDSCSVLLLKGSSTRCDKRFVSEGSGLEHGQHDSCCVRPEDFGVSELGGFHSICRMTGKLLIFSVVAGEAASSTS